MESSPRYKNTWSYLYIYSYTNSLLTYLYLNTLRIFPPVFSIKFRMLIDVCKLVIICIVLGIYVCK